MKKAYLQKDSMMPTYEESEMREIGEDILITFEPLDLVDSEASCITALPRYKGPKNFPFCITKFYGDVS